MSEANIAYNIKEKISLITNFSDHKKLLISIV